MAVTWPYFLACVMMFHVHGLKMHSYDETQASVPKIIHFAAKKPLEEWNEVSYITFVSWESWKKFFPAPEYRTIVSTDDDFGKCIAEEFPNFTSHWDQLKGVEKADVGRYCMLYKYGGIYADLDYEARTNFFDDIIANGNSVTLIEASCKETRRKDQNHLKVKVEAQNSLMASPPKHPFWLEVFQDMQQDSNHAWNAPHGTGPRMLSNVAAHHLSQSENAGHIDSKTNQTDVHFFPCANYQRFGNKCGDYHDVELMKGIHWNQASWKSGKKHKYHQEEHLHEGFEAAHPDLGDVGLNSKEFKAVSNEVKDLFKKVHGERFANTTFDLAKSNDSFQSLFKISA